MSTSRRRDDVIREVRAESFVQEFDTALALSRSAFERQSGLVHLAHYSSGIFTFSLDVLPEERQREVFRQAGRALSLELDTVDRALQEVRTGRLIRTVVHASGGAMFCNAILPTEDVIGLVLDEFGDEPTAHHPSARAGDRAVSALSSRMRSAISLTSLNPGGWETAEDATEPSPSDEDAPPTVTRTTTADERTERLRALCASRARLADLHLVAYCEHEETLFMVDHLSHPRLARFFTQIGVESRRRFYRRFAAEVSRYAASITAIIGTALGGPVIRLVLDVEMGAVFYYRVRPGAYLVGVTLDQSRMSTTDSRLADLARDVRRMG